MTKPIVITMSIELPSNNEIQFFDACNGAAEKLREIGHKALDDGDAEQFYGTSHDVLSDGTDDDEPIGTIKVSK